MVYCATYGCNNDSRRVNKKNGGVSYYRFPKDKNLLREWLVKISCVDLVITEDSRVCSKHFEPQCYERDFRGELLGGQSKGSLKPDAVPTIFGHRPTKKPRLSSERRIEEKARQEVSTIVRLPLNKIGLEFFFSCFIRVVNDSLCHAFKQL